MRVGVSATSCASARRVISAANVALSSLVLRSLHPRLGGADRLGRLRREHRLAGCRRIHWLIRAIEPVHEALPGQMLAAATWRLQPRREFAYLPVDVDAGVGRIGGDAGEEIDVGDVAISPF